MSLPSIKKLPVPYERIIQWAAGPVSALSGLAATFVINQFHVFGPAYKNVVATVIYNVGVFAVTAGVTYAAHHRWLTNLTHWWALPAAHRAALVKESQAKPPAPAAGPPPKI